MSSVSGEYVNGKGKRKRNEDIDDDDDGKDVYEMSGGYVDDDDEPFRFGTSVLPVANLPDSYDGIPQDGMQYLFTVRREERRLPVVTRVANPYVVEEQSIREREEIEGFRVNGDGGIIPSQEWRTCFEDRFNNLRQNMRQSTIHISLPDTSSPKLPEMRDRDRWWAFFRGDVEWESVPSSQFHNTKGNKKKGRDYYYSTGGGEIEEKKRPEPVVHQENLSWDDIEEGEGDVELTYQPEEGIEIEETVNDGGEEDGDGHGLEGGSNPQTGSQSISISTGQRSEKLQLREPTPRILALLDQKFIIHLLKYFTQWIQGHFDHTFLPAPPEPPDPRMKRRYDFTPSHGRWIFALLTQLDLHLTSDEISVLRKLVREIFRLIREERLDQEDRFTTTSQVSHMGEIGCWMIVAAVTGVWGQRDLWSDAADALRIGKQQRFRKLDPNKSVHMDIYLGMEDDYAIRGQ